MRYVFHLYDEHKLYGKLPIVVINNVHTLVGDSNTKCTHLGGVHPMVCDFETNMFASLSFVVSRGVNTVRECYSRLM